ncbi:MAG: hypothetical protein RLZ71_1050 [Actinomycetota bacterium]
MWKIVFLRRATKELQKLDPAIQGLITSYVSMLERHPDPLSLAKPMKGEWVGCYRFRVAKYRLLCEPFEDYLLIEVIRVGKRDSVYD